MGASTDTSGEGAPAEARAAGLRLNEAAAALGPLARRLAEHGQPDAAGLVEQWRTWTEQPVAIAVVGEVKRGKSTLVNALVGQPVTPTGIDVVTRGEIGIAAPTADLPEGRARVFYDDGAVEVVPVAEAVEALRPEGEASERDGGAGSGTGAAAAAGAAPTPRRPSAFAAQVALTPRWVPDAALLDTPGVGGLVGAHAARARIAAERAGALLFVTDGGQVLTRPELDFLRQVALTAEYVVFALTKIDRSDGWQTVLEENRRLLAEHAPRFASAPAFPVAAVLAESAWSQDPETAGMLEAASRVPDLAAGLVELTRNRRRVAIARALRIAVTGFDDALSALGLEEQAVGSEQVVAELVAERERLEELARRRGYLRVYIERDLARARADALSVMNVLVDDATAEVTDLAHSKKGGTAADDVGEVLRQRLRSVVEEVRGRFYSGVLAAVEEAFSGLGPDDEEEADSAGGATVGAAVPGPVIGQGDGPGSDLAARTLAELVPQMSAVPVGDAPELGRVVSHRRVAKTSALDPQMASYGFMGMHLGAVAGPFAPLFAAGWIAVNVVTRRSREGRQQLAMAVGDSFAVLRRDLPAVLDGIIRELRPELILEAERRLEARIGELQRLISDAKAAQAAEQRQRRNVLSKIEVRRDALVEQRGHAEALLAKIAPTPARSAAGGGREQTEHSPHPSP